MKKAIQIACLMVIALTSLGGHARNISIEVNNVRDDLTSQLREQCARATYNDTVTLNFGKGTFTVSGTVVFKCHVVIKGQGAANTTILLDNGKDRTGFKAFTDDTYFKVYGTLQHPVSLEMRNLTMRLKDHKGIWWEDSKKDTEKYAVKIYHANQVDINNVESYMSNAKITNFDLHVCSNVTVTDCILSNYNNCQIGGNLWIRGEMHNILVKNNKFYKYGKDEALGVFGRVVDNSKGYVVGAAKRTDIFIEDNEFYYGYKGKDKDPEAYNHTILTLMTDHKKSQDVCTTRNFHLRNNKFHMTDATARCMYICFDPADVHEGIYIENNLIENENTEADKRYYRQDIEVNDLSSCGDTVHIIGNTVKNKRLVLNPSGNQGYSFLLVQGGNVCLDGNKVINEKIVNPANGKATGMQLVWCGAQGGDVTLRNNVCKGLMCIAYVGAGDGTEHFVLNASNNYFEGSTRVYSHKIKRLDLNFTGNTFKSSDVNFFLQEFADKGTVVFNNNEVTIKGGNGQFMTHWGKNSTHDYHFDKLEVKNNVIRGVNNERDLFKNVTNVKKRNVKANQITR